MLGEKSAPSSEQSHLPCAEFAWETTALRLFILSTYLPVLFPTTLIYKEAVVILVSGFEYPDVSNFRTR